MTLSGTAPYRVMFELKLSPPASHENVAKVLAKRGRLDSVDIAEWVTLREGLEVVRTEAHTLGDYFLDISLYKSRYGTPSLAYLFFEVRLDAGRFWKDLLHRLVVSVEEALPGTRATVLSEYKAHPHSDPDLVLVAPKEGER